MLNKDVSPAGQRTAVVIMTVSTFIVSTTSLADISSSAITHNMVAGNAMGVAVKVGAMTGLAVSATVSAVGCTTIIRSRKTGQNTIYLMTGKTVIMLLVSCLGSTRIRRNRSCRPLGTDMTINTFVLASCIGIKCH